MTKKETFHILLITTTILSISLVQASFYIESTNPGHPEEILEFNKIKDLYFDINPSIFSNPSTLSTNPNMHGHQDMNDFLAHMRNKITDPFYTDATPTWNVDPSIHGHPEMWQELNRINLENIPEKMLTLDYTQKVWIKDEWNLYLFNGCIIENGDLICYGDEPGYERYYILNASDAGGNIIKIIPAYESICALLDTGHVVCTGTQFPGQANRADSFNQDPALYGATSILDIIGSKKPVDARITCVLVDIGTVTCYGLEVSMIDPGSDPLLKYSYSGFDAIKQSMGYGTVCILTSSGNAECFGGSQTIKYVEGDAVSLIHETVLTQDGHQDIACVLTTNQDINCFNYDDPSNNPGCYNPPSTPPYCDPLVQVGNYTGGDAKKAIIGHLTDKNGNSDEFVCALTESKNVDCFGSGPDQSKADYNGSDALDFQFLGSSTCVLDTSRNVKCYEKEGTNGQGNLPNYMEGDAVSFKSVHSFLEPGVDNHYCVLTTSGNLICLGESGTNSDLLSDFMVGDVLDYAVTPYKNCIYRENGNVECQGLLGGGGNYIA